MQVDRAARPRGRNRRPSRRRSRSACRRLAHDRAARRPRRTGPAPTTSVSARCSSTESASPTAPAMPPCAYQVFVSVMRAFVTRFTVRPRAGGSERRREPRDAAADHQHVGPVLAQLVGVESDQVAPAERVRQPPTGRGGERRAGGDPGRGRRPVELGRGDRVRFVCGVRASHLLVFVVGHPWFSRSRSCARRRQSAAVRTSSGTSTVGASAASASRTFASVVSFMFGHTGSGSSV